MLLDRGASPVLALASPLFDPIGPDAGKGMIPNGLIVPGPRA